MKIDKDTLEDIAGLIERIEELESKVAELAARSAYPIPYVVPQYVPEYPPEAQTAPYWPYYPDGTSGNPLPRQPIVTCKTNGGFNK